MTVVFAQAVRMQAVAAPLRLNGMFPPACLIGLAAL